MTFAEFLTSKWGIFICAFLVGMLAERLHVERVREKQKRLAKAMHEIIVELVQVHGWLRTVGTPQDVLSKVEAVVVTLDNHNREI